MESWLTLESPLCQLVLSSKQDKVQRLLGLSQGVDPKPCWVDGWVGGNYRRIVDVNPATDYHVDRVFSPSSHPWLHCIELWVPSPSLPAATPGPKTPKVNVFSNDGSFLE